MAFLGYRFPRKPGASRDIVRHAPLVQLLERCANSSNHNHSGDVFLRNVVAVFDIGKEELKFAPHVNY